FLGIWAAALDFPIWITYNLVGSALLNAVITRGGVGMLWAALSSVAGAMLWGLIDGFGYRPETSETVTLLCVLGAVNYVSVVGYVVYRQTRRLAAARDALGKSEDRYRLIAENAADLIAMVDHEGRWLYTSPSYARMFEPQEVAPGVDAFRRVHPDDAEQAPSRVVLVSQDVTDLRESEERLLLAAHALEGMTEAIMITAADGTIVTVNRAFSELTGYTRDDVLGQPEKSVRNALQPPEYYDEIAAAVQKDGYWSGTTWSRRKNGSVYREWRSVRAMREPGGPVTHTVIVFSEVGRGLKNNASSAQKE